jgi:hypothetical protein
VAAEEQASETVAELESRGCTHIEIACAACGHVGRRSLFLLRTRAQIARNMTFEMVARCIRCAKCRARANLRLVRVVWPEMASPQKTGKVEEK